METYTLPSKLTTLISQEDFNLIFGFAREFLAGSGFTHIRMEDDFLKYDGDGSITYQVSIVNLAKQLLNEDRENWKKHTCSFLEKLAVNKQMDEEVLADFEKAKTFLTIRIHPVEAYSEEPLAAYAKKLALKEDIPGMYSLLSLDLPTRFIPVTKEHIAHWNKEMNELFGIAHKNMKSKKEEVSITEYNWEGARGYTIFDRDYSAALCTDFGNNFKDLHGRKGAMVSIPSKGSVFVHPIVDAEQFNAAFNYMAQQTNSFYEQEDGALSRNLYWFHDGRFEAFEITTEGDGLSYSIPATLNEKLTKRWLG